MFKNLQHSRTRRLTSVLLAASIVAGVALQPGAVHADKPQMQTVKSRDLGADAAAALSAYQRWIESEQPIAWVEFSALRDALAETTAANLGIEAAGLKDEWARSDVANQVIVVAALSQLGVPYRTNAMAEGKAFDCSGLTKWAYAQADVALPRVSWDQIRAAASVERDQAQPGDLVQYPGHIGLYLGQGGYIDAPNTGNVVRVHGLPSRSLRFGDATAA